jgi:thiamine pyrophosphate-dependent acetolactate synthase large subunit-like protein
MAATVCDLLIETLAEVGAGHMFGVPGDAINTLVDSLRRNDRVKFIQVRHEEAGAFAASAQAKLTGRLGVCCGTAGPGAVHLLNGLYDAKLDHAPVLAITGQVETTELGHDYHQEIDLKKLFDDVAVYNQTIVSPEQAPRMIAAAIQTALVENGVAHLSLPQGIASQSPSGPKISINTGRPLMMPSTEQLDHAAALLGDAERPVILAGIGAADAAAELVALAERLGAPVVHSLRAKDILADDHPFNIGGLGLLGGRPGLDAMEACDLLLMIGTDFPYRDFYPENAKVVQIEQSPARLGRRLPLSVGLLGHSRPTLQALLAKLQAGSDRRFLEDCRKRCATQLERMAEKEASDTTPIAPHRLAARIGALARDDAVFLCDTGEVTVWGARHLHLRRGQRFTLSGQLASMAFGLPAAIGASLAMPGRQIIALCGDGGFGMLMADFLTAVKYELPLTCVIFNNHKLGLIEAEAETAGLPAYAVELHNPDFAAFARLCGGEGWRVTDPGELDAALAAAFASGKPAVVDVAIDPDVLPMPPEIKFGQAANFTLAKLKELMNKIEL